jgi:hypothetical protein
MRITKEIAMKYGRLVLVAALAAAAGTAQAAGLGVRAGTTGVGVDYGFAVAPTLGARVGVSALNLNTDVDTSDVSYDAKAKLANVNLLLDFSPAGPFRISAGFIANNNKFDLSGQPTSGSFQGTSLSGTVKPDRSFAPYLGVGYGNVWTTGVNFYVDAGVMFQGSPRVNLSVNCVSASPAQCAAAQNEVAAEQRRVQDKLDKYKYYPVINLGITIGF